MALRPALILSFAIGCCGGALADPLPCPRPDTLGVQREIAVDTRGGLHVGRFQYPSTLDLRHHEVVLTFDDGPNGALTPRILAALAAECTKATFFMVGRMAAGEPSAAQAVARAGHTIGHHSMTHPAPMTLMMPAAAEADIDRGMQTIHQALGPYANRFAPGFFRYPGLWNPKDVDLWLAERGIGVFGIDAHARDWELRDPKQVIDLAMARLEAQGKGILLLHDIQPVTAAALPELLWRLKTGGWKVVHMVPAARDAWVDKLGLGPNSPEPRHF